MGHDIIITLWTLSIKQEVCDNVINLLVPEHRKAVERVVIKMHQLPFNNPAVLNKSLDAGNMETIVSIFWDEFRKFWARKDDNFGNPSRWNVPEVRAVLSHIWHEKYVYPYTQVLGYITCRTTGMQNGIRAAERIWVDVKLIKDEKRSGISGESI